MALLEVKNLGISFGGLRAVDRFEVEIKKGQLYGLIGPNGAGKTTVFNMLTGVYKPTDGIIKLDGEDLVGKKTIEINKAGIARTFQNIRLFSQQSVLDNVKIGLHNQYKYSALTGILRLPKYHKLEKEMNEKAMELLKVFELDAKADFLASNLPYGEQRKLEIARALATNPKLLLLDEPLSNLDAKLRLSMRVEIKRLQKKLGITTLFVTHDQEECFSISDKVAVMNGGVIEQYDTPENIYRRPATEFVARFIGFENFLDVEKKADHLYVLSDGTAFKTAMDLDGGEYAATIRPDDIRLADDKFSENVLSGKVGVRTFLGKSYQYEVETAAGVLKVNMGTDHVFKEGDMLRLYLPEDKLILVRR